MKAHGTYRKAAASLGLAASTFQNRYQKATRHAREPEAEEAKPAFGGSLHVAGRERRQLPSAGETRVYILTSAQNNTALHEECWRNLMALAAHDGAEIIVGAFTYAVASRAASGQKRKTSKEAQTSYEAWDERLEPHFVDRRVEIAPGLVWCGELQILPTANDPIGGMESYTGQASCIIPHVKFAVTCVPTSKMKRTKFIYTTGCVTLRNYIQKKAGQKAEFHHGYGALIVEVDSDGSWFARQLNADSDGVIYDLDRKVQCGSVTSGHRPEAIVWGDIHVRQLEAAIAKLQWGNGGILERLRPNCQILHDLIDFRAQNHHDRGDAWKVFMKRTLDKTSVDDELREAAGFLWGASRVDCKTIIVRSNHDEALVRWLKEADFRDDPENAILLLEASLFQYRQISSNAPVDIIQWALERYGFPFPGVRFLRRDEEFIVCPDANGGIELGMHGDKGANGARGSLAGFAKAGIKCIVGHSHYAGLKDGAMQVGVSASLDQDYNEGQSSWSHTHAIVYPNGKRTLFTVHDGRWCGQLTMKKMRAD